MPSTNKTTENKTAITPTVTEKGRLVRVAGPVVFATGISPALYDLARIGKLKLLGEVIAIRADESVIQVYEDTSGLRPGDPVEHLPHPLSVELGPGLLGSIYDGIQRPLPLLERESGPFIGRGITAPALDRSVRWEFTALRVPGENVQAGARLGYVMEHATKHYILVPPERAGTLAHITSGAFTVNDVIATLTDGRSMGLVNHWPVRVPRPATKKLPPKTPLTTGTRILDALFPITKGGVAAMPGPFGAGKTVNQQQLAKWSNADIIVYIGCGERGNEMTEILTEFPHLMDPQTNRPLMDRTVLIANTSNMPVAAREASIYVGATIAEYYRDMGYDVALMADSTSRWAEAMREISSRLEEMPGEEGFPAYLGTRLSQFYERAGRVESLSGEKGSVTIIGAVSPPGGDFSEPVTQNTLRVTKAFWGLDHKLSQRRHFPSINWLTSYSLYHDALAVWYVQNVAQDWAECVQELTVILQEEEKLLEIVQLVGNDALPEKQQIILLTARIIREGFLQQNAFHEVDTMCSLRKSYLLMKTILRFHHLATHAIESGVRINVITSVPSKDALLTAKHEADAESFLAALTKKMDSEFLERTQSVMQKTTPKDLGASRIDTTTGGRL
jgi:V/A-type H+-transporting ATPase subunit A